MTWPTAEEVDRAARLRLKPIEEATKRGDSEIQRFYYGAVVMVTGGSGFLGKQLIEKLFRTFDIKKLYILLRPKKGKSVGQRLDYILKSPVYDTLRETRPWFADRIEAVEGDITKSKLGLEEDTLQRLVDEVTIIFHCAATVSFVDPFKVAVDINVRGTMEILELGKACKHLLAFVHVSTAYAQALDSLNNTDIPDEFAASPMSPTALVELANATDQKTMDEIGQKLGIGTEHANTYAYTKAVAEEAVRTASSELPICVVRPSVVTPAYTEPEPGWTDMNTVFGGSGYILGLSLGIIHTVVAVQDIKIDIIPVDFVNNVAIVAGFETARRTQQGEKECKIYTIGSSWRNPIKWSFLSDTLNVIGRRHVSHQAVWYAFACQTSSKTLYYILSFILHFIPGFIIDAVLILMGRKPQAIKLYKQIFKLCSVLAYYTCRTWGFKDDNTIQLYNKLSNTDKQIFNMDISKVDMEELVLLWNIGLRKFILKDKLGNDEQASRKQLMLKMATYTITPIYLYVLYKIFSFVLYGLFCLIF